MDFNYDETTKTTHITAYEDTDICTKCDKALRKVCPLLICISQNYVYPAAASLAMAECLLYDFVQKQKTKEDESDA